jgi:hypothetical protein
LFRGFFLIKFVVFGRFNTRSTWKIEKKNSSYGYGTILKRYIELWNYELGFIFFIDFYMICFVFILHSNMSSKLWQHYARFITMYRYLGYEDMLKTFQIFFGFLVQILYN